MTMKNEFKVRLLVVDDEPVILQTMTAILENEGFAVLTAEDGFAALNILRGASPDLIITDLRMPNMSGFELLSVVRRRYPHIPIIVISGEYVLEGVPAGLLMDAFFQKGGYTPPQLFEAIRQFVADSPIRPHLAKLDKAPLWIPRRDADYIVLTCTDCLRSFPVSDSSTGSEVHEVECPSCVTMVKYMVDSAVMKMLEVRKSRLPSTQLGAIA
jgi:CheY-like chemotaxis protein